MLWSIFYVLNTLNFTLELKLVFNFTLKEQEAEIKTKQDLIHKERDKILQTEYALRNEQQKLKSDIEGEVIFFELMRNLSRSH